jgi:D-alanine transaminase
VSSSGDFCVSADTIDGKSVGGKAPELLKKIQDEALREFTAATGYTPEWSKV